MLAVSLLGCAATTLRARRQEPPLLTLPSTLVALDVQDCPEKDALAQVLPEAVTATGTSSVADCQVGPECTAGVTLKAVVTERTLTAAGGIPDTLTLQAVAGEAAQVKVTTKVTVTGWDALGNKLFGREYTGWKVGNLLEKTEAQLTFEALQYALSGLTGDLRPKELRLELKLETGGDLDQGVGYALAGDLDSARTAFSQVTARRPDDAAAWYDLGVVNEVAGDDAQALECYRKAASLDDEWLYAQALEQLQGRRRH
jgi:tetratricopeptide (TPR) repeat protein